MTSRWLLACSALTLLCAPLQAANITFTNGGGDGLFSNPANWQSDTPPVAQVPGLDDLALHDGTTAAALQINADWETDSLRLSNGGSVSHTAGVLTIDALAPTRLWVGEFGPAATSYTLDGGSIVIEESNDTIDVGRTTEADGTFTFLSGMINNPNGVITIGRDGTGTWNQSGGSLVNRGVQIGRFGSASGTVTLSGSTDWDILLLLLADANVSGSADLSIVGPNVSLDATGLIMKANADLTFDGAGGGISTINLDADNNGGGNFLLTDGELFLNNLPTPTSVGETLVLIDNIGAYTGADTEFDNAPQGAAFDGWEIDYSVASQVRLVSVIPEPTTALLVLCGLTVAAAGRRR